MGKTEIRSTPGAPASGGQKNRLAEQVTQVQEDLVGDMVMLCGSAATTYGIILSSEERDALREAIREHVTRSIEIEAKIIANLERANGDGPEAA